MVSATDWVSSAALTVIGLAVGVNVAQGTFPKWLSAKFLLDAAPPAPVTVFGGEAGGLAAPDATNIVRGGGTRTGATGRVYGDPLPAGRLISPFGACRSGISCSGSCCRRHKGIDIAAPSGTPVYTVAPGTVSSTFNQTGACGLGVTVAHADGTSALYCHLSSILVTDGQQLGLGSPVGRVGNTGNATGTTPHLHFEIRRGGTSVDPTQLIGR